MLTDHADQLTFTCDGCGTATTRASGDRMPPGYYGTYVVVAEEAIDTVWMSYYACRTNCVPGAIASMQTVGAP